MGLRIFPIVGEALNFGGRRMATIMRVAWLPVALSLIVNMASVFAYLSVIAGRLITFSDVDTFLAAQSALARFAAQGWSKNFEAMAAIAAGNIILQAVLIASFMAPLVRYAGLGEKPAPGVIRLAFGPDQIRYIAAGVFSFLFVALLVLAPMVAASIYALKYIVEAMSQTMVSFPDTESLHSIELVTFGETLVADGAAWIVNLAIPLTVVAPFAFVLWIIIFLHFHPRNRLVGPGAGEPFKRALFTLAGVALIAGGAVLALREQIDKYVKSASKYGGKALADVSKAPGNAVLFFGVVAYLLVSYFNLRLFAYPGVAVCRKSMSLAHTWRVTRGWDLVRLQIIILFVGAVLFAVQTYVINGLFLEHILPMLFGQLYRLTIVSTRLVNSGVSADWVQPVFVWTWNMIKILINVFWAFFFYGVAAGLYGRLYRESEQA